MRRTVNVNTRKPRAIKNAAVTFGSKSLEGLSFVPLQKFPRFNSPGHVRTAVKATTVVFKP